MHNLAIALHNSGHEVSGSDDQIFEPSRSRLAAKGLLPAAEGWDESNISTDLDAIILGMHARKDNPELLKAQALDLNIFSYPEFLYEVSKDMTRVVIAGSHGKTTTTAMVLHAMQHAGMSTNYMVGAQLEGFDCMVELESGSDFMVMEGDEYLSSPIDLRPKFHLYRPNITVITGIAWDHINVFPTEESYLDTFRAFIDTIEPNGTLVYCNEDNQLNELVSEFHAKRRDIKFIPYSTPSSTPGDTFSTVEFKDGSTLNTPLVGSHNYQNLEGAKSICSAIGIEASDFLSTINDFKGAARRLEVITEKDGFVAFRDFAHAPSKLKATQAGVVGSYPNRKVTAVFELHTFSSLNKDFLPQYVDSMNSVDYAIVYYDPAVVEHKRLPAISPKEVITAFNRANIEVITSVKILEERIKAIPTENHCVLLMSSGRFGGAELAF